MQARQAGKPRATNLHTRGKLILFARCTMYYLKITASICFAFLFNVIY